MRIEIFGPGCAKCKRLKSNVREAVEEMAIEADIVEVDDLQEMMDRGVMMTPALFVNGEAKAVGRVPNQKEIMDILGS